MKAMHRARAKKYYAKKKTSKVIPPEPTEVPTEVSESESSDTESDCRVKRRRMDSDVIIPYRDIKKCVRRALKEEKEKGSGTAGYAAAAVGGIGLVSTILNRLPANLNPLRFLGLSDATSTLPMVLPLPPSQIVQSDVQPSINVGD